MIVMGLFFNLLKVPVIIVSIRRQPTRRLEHLMDSQMGEGAFCFSLKGHIWCSALYASSFSIPLGVMLVRSRGHLKRKVYLLSLQSCSEWAKLCLYLLQWQGSYIVLWRISEMLYQWIMAVLFKSHIFHLEFLLLCSIFSLPNRYIKFIENNFTFKIL